MQLVRFQKSKVVEYKHNVLLKSCLPVQICTNATNGGCLRFVLHRKTAIGRESHLYTNSGMMQIAREVQIRAKSQITRDGGSVCNHKSREPGDGGSVRDYESREMAGSVRNHKSREIADPHVIINCERWRIRTSSQIAKDGGSVRNRRLREMTDPYVITNCERWRIST